VLCIYYNMKLATGRNVEKVPPSDWIKSCPKDEFADFVLNSLRKQPLKTMAASC
jgi:hypothetical protein